MYPGHSDDPLDGFRNLGADLNKFAEVFLLGNNHDLSVRIKQAQKLDAKWHNLSPFQRLEVE